MACLILTDRVGDLGCVARYADAKIEVILTHAREQHLNVGREPGRTCVHGTPAQVGYLLRSLHLLDIGGLDVDVATPDEARVLSLAGRFRYVTPDGISWEVNDWHDRVFVRWLAPPAAAGAVAVASELARVA